VAGEQAESRLADPGAYEPGASVSVVARRYNVNANQVFSWRRRYGEASKSLDVPPSSSGLVPVTITPGAEDEFVAPSTLAVSDTIEIEVPDGSRVRVG
jgi:transposase